MGFVRQRPLTFYVSLAVLVVCGVMAAFIYLATRDPKVASLMPGFFGWLRQTQAYPNIATIGAFALASPAFFLVLLFAVAPSIAAVTTAALSGRLGELNGRVRLFAPDIGARRASIVYFALIAFFLAGLLLHFALTARYGEPGAFARAIEHLGGSFATVVPLALIGALIDEGGSLEELGWRGFALPLLQERYSPLIATLILGSIWWAWHLPREIPDLLAGTDLWAFGQSQAIFLLLCLALSIVITYAVNSTGGSVWPAVFLHGGTNVWSKAVGAPDLGLPFNVRDLIVIATAVIVLAVVGPRLGKSDAAATARERM